MQKIMIMERRKETRKRGGVPHQEEKRQKRVRGERHRLQRCGDNCRRKVATTRARKGERGEKKGKRSPPNDASEKGPQERLCPAPGRTHPHSPAQKHHQGAFAQHTVLRQGRKCGNKIGKEGEGKRKMKGKAWDGF